MGQAREVSQAAEKKDQPSEAPATPIKEEKKGVDSKESDERKETPIQPAAPTPDVAPMIAAAREAVAAGNWLEALRLFKDVHEVDPNNADALASIPLIERRLAEVRGTVRVDTVPAGATVRLGSAPEQKSPAIFTSVPFGDYELSITMDGFDPIIREVEVKGESPIDLAGIILKPSSGQIEVVSEPKGAEFKVVRTRESKPEELVKVGQTPAKIDKLDPGDYEVFMSISGFPEQAQKVRVERNRNSSVSAVFARGSLNLTSDPSGAEVLIASEEGKEANFRRVGNTPLSIPNLTAGKHRIELRYGDWRPIHRTVNVVAGATQDLDFEWTRSLVSFESDPPGAEVYLENRRLGRGMQTTPFQWELPEGNYTLHARHSLLGDVTQTIEIGGETGSTSSENKTGSDSRSNRVEFRFDYGSVALESDPPGAAVVSDGRPLGRTPLILSVVPPGEHRYELSKEGFRAATIGGMVESGAKLRFSAALTYDPTPVTSRNFVNGLGRPMVWIPDLKGWAGAYEVTQAEYERLGGNNPSYFKAPDHPVDSVTWFDAVRFCEALSSHEKALGTLPAGYRYRLPTDEEWDHLVAGQKLDGAISSLFQRQLSTAPVGSLPPNDLGLYDVRGNVLEWVSDWYSQTIVRRIQRDGATPNPEWVGTDRKVLRGGAWNRSGKYDLEIGTRMAAAPASKDRYDIGFRVVLMRD